MLAEVANAVRRGGLRVEHLLEPRALPLLLDSNTSSILGSYGDHEVHGPGGVDMLGLVGTGGPAGLRHFVYKTNFLDQYVASEFSPPLHIPSAQKRYITLKAPNEQFITCFRWGAFAFVVIVTSLIFK